MKILIIGGGIFVGRALIEAALAKSHQVTAFSRGRTPLPHPEKISMVIGDRNIPADLQKLADFGPWDTIVDTCGYRPNQVRLLLNELGHSTSHFTFISSISAYANLAEPNVSEIAPLAASLEAPGEEVVPQNYGPLKADCERETAPFDQTLIIRPGIIAGPHDPTDRLAYWIEKIRKEEIITVPHDMPGVPVQVIDVRDLAAWLILQIEQRAIGAFNAVNPRQPITCAEIFQSIADSLGKKLQFETASPEDLVDGGANLKADFPFYVPAGLGADGLFRIDGRKAWETGLLARPIADTARDTAQWFAENRTGDPKLGWTKK